MFHSVIYYCLGNAVIHVPEDPTLPRKGSCTLRPRLPLLHFPAARRDSDPPSPPLQHLPDSLKEKHVNTDFKDRSLHLKVNLHLQKCIYIFVDSFSLYI